ncbi:MAG: DnaA ATPase domain-containing protein, partial [Gemmatimonadota bacterium]
SDPAVEVRYVPAEALVEELLVALRRGDLESFRAGLRHVDVLLVDDVQFLAGQTETQAELLQALEGIQRRRGQVVLTCDRGPDEIAALDDRILARFRGGLIVDVQNPDYETRAAILRFKIREHGEELSPEIVDELAVREFSNIRELEGALHKLIMLRAVHDGPLTPGRLRELLRSSLPPRAVPEERANEFEDFLSNMADTISSVLEDSETPAAEPATRGTQASTAGASPAPSEPLRPPLAEYSFGAWLVGPGNRLATESARRVLSESGTRYNPLFVHSSSGMGKTHLLNAIGNALLERDPAARVCCQSAESFTEELITAIQEGDVARLRGRYHGADVLLLDDAHTLGGRERTQEEFFHVFNELHARKRQIVLTSDRPPRELAGVERRLVSRFEGGLVVEIGELEEETAARALLTFLRAEGFALGEPLAAELARRLQPRNMREVQGQAKRAALRAESAGAAKDEAFLQRVLLQGRPEPRERSAERVDPFFRDPYKVFPHWDPVGDRLLERLEGEAPWR